MRRTLLIGLFTLSGLALLVSSTPARALVAIAPGMINPGPARAGQSDAVVVGRVVAIEDKDVQAKGGTYRIAVVQVTESLKGTGEQMVKVGFVPVKAPNVGNPAIRPLPSSRFGSPQLTVGQDGLFFLNKGPDGKFFTVSQNWSFVASTVNNYKSEVDTAKVAIKVGTKYTDALKSKDAQERLFGAAMLIEKYRAPMLKAKIEPINAEESKLIMKALAEGDWTNTNFGPTHPWNLFNRLGITAQDGWQYPKGVRDQKDVMKAAQQWVAKNVETYRIKANVGGQPIRPGIRPLPIERPIQIQPINPRILPVQPPQVLPPQVLPPQVLPPQAQPGRIQILPAPRD